MGPGGSGLSDAKRTREIFEEVFRAGTKTCPYDFYRQLAIWRLSPSRKRELPRSKLRGIKSTKSSKRSKLRGITPVASEIRHWAEEEDGTRAELRERIRHEVDQLPNTGFPLKCDNWMRLKSEAARERGEEGVP
jgi:hypothetical protein